MGNPIYLLILLGILFFARALQKYNNLQLFRNRFHMYAYVVTNFILGVVWDYFSVWLKIWEFPFKGTIGIRIGILPIEEFLFFLILPYFGITVFKLFEKKFK